VGNKKEERTVVKPLAGKETRAGTSGSLAATPSSGNKEPTSQGKKGRATTPKDTFSLGEGKSREGRKTQQD